MLCPLTKTLTSEYASFIFTICRKKKPRLGGVAQGAPAEGANGSDDPWNQILKYDFKQTPKLSSFRNSEVHTRKL